MTGPSGSRAFTLIELMIVVAIIGILAAIAIPKFANLVRKSREGSTRGNLGALKSAMSIYYGDLEGQFPVALDALTIGGKYLTKIPQAKTPNYHNDSSAIITASEFEDLTDVSGWAYINYPDNPDFGEIHINCFHTDTKGENWANY
ncbi:MAG: prepilin-type N-terminal cleavage/methylation domain-containing protein [Elusimicrobia bacterium]|nr:prepilin-type N-terminal cleavage/methylation domain-containing protein [Elusimicrobiota bacterium]